MVLLERLQGIAQAQVVPDCHTAELLLSFTATTSICTEFGASKLTYHQNAHDRRAFWAGHNEHEVK